ncbi:MAG: T9SS type A sorting domain-containing protein [Candidatus Kapaibacterium sp.]
MIRTLLLLIISSFFVQVVSAQTELVITYENAGFDKPGDSAYTRNYEPSFFTLPETGENVTWDYSNIIIDGLRRFVTGYLEPDKSAFPNATFSIKARYALNEFTLTGHAFYELRDSGEYYVGNHYDGATFDLGLGYLGVPEQTVPLSVGYNDLLLPASMGTTWSTTTVSNLTTYLTLPPLGLDEASLVLRQYNSYEDEIVGSGTLVLPGGQSFQALLRKEVRVHVDSFFLNNQPAPSDLLDLFGVVQGGSDTREEYTFFSPGISSHVMKIIVTLGSYDIYLRDDLSTSSVADGVAETASVRLYPNPAKGGTIAMEFEKSSDAPWELVICNPLGEIVQTVPVERSAGNVRLLFEPGASMSSGMYFCELRNEEGKRVAGRSFMLAR